MVLAVISATLGGRSTAVGITKITLIYLGILIEVVGDVGSFFFLRSHIRYEPRRISERLACLSLIILGEFVRMWMVLPADVNVVYR